MTEFKYCVYCEDEPAICFNTEADAMKFAREDTSMYNSVKVEKSEIDEAGEVLNTEIIWTASGNNVPEKEIVSDNEFETDFPESDIADIDTSDDIDYDELARQYAESPADWIDDNKLIKEAVDALEENEDEVECKICFELGPKAEMKKLDIGYVCPKCAQELQSHQGTNLDLIDEDPFSLNYEDPRDFDEPEEIEVKEAPVDANEVRKFEAGIEEKLEEHINDRPADIESDQVLQGVDNAVVNCETDQKVIAHSEDEKPLDCKIEKPALEEPLAGEKVDVKLNEELKVIIDFSEYKPWSGAVDTYELIKDAGKLDDLEAYLEECFPDGITAGQINDILWFDSDQVLSYLGLGDTEEEDIDESLQEAKKDDELPVDPEAVKLEVHNTLNSLVADEIDTVANYEEAKSEIADTHIEHKDEIISKIDSVEDDTKEHIDELIDAASEIPFDGEHKEEAPAPVVEEPVAEEEPLNQDFPEVEENLKEKVDLPAFDSDIKVGDKIRIIHLEGEDNSYDGKEGTVDHIDSIGQLHGTWGGLAIIPGVDDFDIITENLTEKKLKLYDIFDDGEYIGQLEAADEEDAVNQCYNGAFGKSSSDNLFTAELAECLTEAKAKPEADKVQCYNDGLKLAKAYNKPVIYGYTNSSYNGKFFKLDDPIICDNVSDETKKFKQQYKSCNVAYVAYPSGQLIERLLEELPEGTTEVDYVEYKHSYCHALEPKLEELKKIEDIEELKKAILDIINNDPQVNWTKKEKKFAAIVRHKKWKSVEDLKAYLDNSIAKAKEIKVSVDTDGELVKKLTEEIEFDENGDEIFTPEEQEEFDCDEWGYSNEGYDQFHHCGWCEEIFPESDMRHEVDFGWICDRCEAELKSHGGPLTFIENEELNEINEAKRQSTPKLEIVSVDESVQESDDHDPKRHIMRVQFYDPQEPTLMPRVNMEFEFVRDLDSENPDARKANPHYKKWFEYADRAYDYDGNLLPDINPDDERTNTEKRILSNIHKNLVDNGIIDDNN